MLLALAIIIVSLVVQAVQLVDGNQRIVYVSESISDHFTSGDDGSNLMCCVYGNCSCNSLDHALANLTSNVLINITTNVKLSLLINASSLENVSIIGHNYPTVNCTNAGGVHFNFCHNCIIQDITWDGCGTNTKAAINLSDSSNIIIEHCSFQYSNGPAIALSGVSGQLNIGRCNFVYNNHYGGQGAAIHYSSSKGTNDFQFFLAISNCNFTNNKNTKSLVYVENILSKYANNITFHNTTFCHNQGVSIYVINQTIYLQENILFQNNTAENGAGIYMEDHSTVIFGKNSDVMFIQNSADYNGGAVFLRNHSSIIFDQNSIATFNDNDATSGIIYSKVKSNVTFQATSQVTFINNSVKCHGSAIYSSGSYPITFTGNSKVEFISNVIRGYCNGFSNGGTIYSKRSHIHFEGNSITLFRNNVANKRSGGGAIRTIHSPIYFDGNSITLFSDNVVYGGIGGAIYSTDHSSISLKGNSTTEFTNNIASTGGAIRCDQGFLSFKQNSTAVFSSNTDGAIYTLYSSLSFEDNSTTKFTNNAGGALYLQNDFISFKGNSTTEFTNNTAVNGSAIHCSYNGSISFENNSITEFINNTATENGGAIYFDVRYNSSVIFQDNSTTKFTNNTAGDYGGAIYSSNASISSKNNSHIEFNNNVATRGGAIYLHTRSFNFVSFEGFSATVFSNNIAKDYGGTIIAEGGSEIIFCNNSTVKFTHKNAPFGEMVYCGSNSNVTIKGNATIIFNDALAKWCSNICTPYTGQGAVTIDSNGIVRCSDQKAFACLSENCKCRDLEYLLHNLTIGTSNITVNVADKAVLLNNVKLNSLGNVSIVGENNFTVLCGNNGLLVIEDCKNLTIEGISWIGYGRFSDNRLNKKYFTIINKLILGKIIVPALISIESSPVIIQKSNFHYLMGSAIRLSSSNFIMSWCSFMNNNYYKDHGAAIAVVLQSYSRYITEIIVNNCEFSFNKGVKSIVYLEDAYQVFMYSTHTTFYNNNGVSIYLSRNCALHISGDILFKNNRAENGAGIYISDHSTVKFGENSNVTFTNNSVDHSGSAIYMKRHSNVTFEQNSVATFDGNKGVIGTIYCEDNSNITFEATSQVIFNSNSVTQYGAAIYSFDNSHVTFTGSSNITFSNNTISTNVRSKDIEFGGIVFSSTYSHTLIDRNSTVVFSNNSASVGAAIFSIYKSSITFKDRSKVMFNNNVVQYCGIVTSSFLSNVAFNDNTESFLITIQCHVHQLVSINYLLQLSAPYIELMSCFQGTL